MAKKSSSYKGLQNRIRSLKTPALEALKNQYPDRDYTVYLQTEEFNCLCPKTGLPDFAVLKIEYMPDKYCIELKSFKEYIVFYRNVGIFHEHAVNKILDDFIKACKPRFAKITGEFNIRGGIKTVVSREYYKSKRRKK